MWNHVTSCDIIFFGCFNQVCMVCAHVFVSNCSPFFPWVLQPRLEAKLQPDAAAPAATPAATLAATPEVGGKPTSASLWYDDDGIEYLEYQYIDIDIIPIKYIPSSLHQQNNWYDDGNEYWPYMNVSWNYSILQLYITIWRFPEMGGTPQIIHLNGFSMK